MQKSKPQARGFAFALVVAVAALVFAISAGAGGGFGHQGKNAYVTHNLVSDQPGVADTTDPNLVNAWGLDALPTSPWWVSDNGKDVSTLYNAAGVPFPQGSPLVVKVPSAPTGLVANTGTSFVITSGVNSASPRFLFATEQGQILGWNPAVSADAVKGPVQFPTGAVYKGLAISPTGDRIYATDFHNGAVDVYDGSWNPVNTPGAFVDPSIPQGFAPFGIQAVGDKLVVTYAKQDAQAMDEVDQPGFGFVDLYNLNGNLLAHVAKGWPLNAPWGIALAPPDFGRFSNDLLIGNFGDGTIDAFALQQKPSDIYAQHHGRGWFKHEGFRHHGYRFAGVLKGTDHFPIVIDRLWALEFGKGSANNGPTNTLFFTAGPSDETHGLFGTINTAP
jgi:uncharacterized protein (TIGR03118 family)